MKSGLLQTHPGLLKYTTEEKSGQPELIPKVIP
jgi:preprotein translocase subunit Sec61beta